VSCVVMNEEKTYVNLHRSVPLKIIGKEFQKNYYKTIFRQINTEETFCHLHLLQIKTIFQEKGQFAKIYCRGICYLYLWSLVPITG